MNPSENPIGIAPPQPTNPEDDPKLQAIEALEARPEDLEARPIVPAKPVASPAPIVQAPAPAPVPAPAPEQTPAPVSAPITVVGTPAPVAPKEAPVIVPEKPVIPEKPAIPQTMSAKMAAELANDGPVRGRFQFFLRQKISTKPLIIGISVIAAIIIGVVIYIVSHPQG